MNSIQRGQAITFRLPADTPDHILKQLQKLRETEKRNFSSTIASFALEGVKESLVKERESLTIPLPKQLTPEQRSWLRHAQSEALIGTIVYQLIEDPVRATALFATLNSNARDIDEALYLQEPQIFTEEESSDDQQKHIVNDESHDDLANFDLTKAQQDIHHMRNEETIEEDKSNLLDDFIAQMNR